MAPSLILSPMPAVLGAQGAAVPDSGNGTSAEGEGRDPSPRGARLSPGSARGEREVKAGPPSSSRKEIGQKQSNVA